MVKFVAFVLFMRRGIGYTSAVQLCSVMTFIFISTDLHRGGYQIHGGSTTLFVGAK